MDKQSTYFKKEIEAMTQNEIFALKIVSKRLLDHACLERNCALRMARKEILEQDIQNKGQPMREVIRHAMNISEYESENEFINENIEKVFREHLEKALRGVVPLDMAYVFRKFLVRKALEHGIEKTVDMMYELLFSGKFELENPLPVGKVFKKVLHIVSYEDLNA